ncbi:lipoprotein insertase outer membrane protein LolB [Uliginosibacterium sp. 31-16]|uniref:lipoprotein insertase outer membrane protein LolB n=1 Tax=Uliginosibacterium sp. 31-16 TaxID=3068315 RepID=UPI00273E356D|nr:lipoprotein insertase outer membrane protein LolB [Uliginosibacterium sp. 31-16]MDP5241152.1 lipoprotein insertase outer membrane protein LolB [Uliginosibacterium sp. 31-16]
MTSRFHKFCIGLFVLLLAACSSQPKPDLPPRPLRDSLQKFTLEGRIAFSQSGRSSTVRLSWEHAPETDLIGFASPLGNQLAELQRDQQGARWTTSDGERYEAHSADQLLTRLTDTPIPLDSLSLWVLGRIGRQGEILERDASGRLLVAIDNNWRVRITAYESEQPNALPKSLEVEGSGLRVKLAIEAWQL